MTLAQAHSRVFGHIVEDSLEEAGFLWARWERFLDAPHLSLADVFFWVEDRLQGALDGVRCGGDAVLDTVLEPALASDERGLVSAAAHVLASSSHAGARELLLRALLGFSGPLLAAVRRGVELAPASRGLLPQLAAAASEVEPDNQVAVLELHAAFGQDPGVLLMQLAASGDARVRAAALRACPVGLAGDALARQALADSEPLVVAAAVELGLCCHTRGAWESCLDLCSEPKPAPEAHALLPLLAMSGSARAHTLLQGALAEEALQRAAVAALGVSGRLDDAERCCELLRSGQHVKLAADALCAITGLQLEAHKLVADEPLQEEAEPSEDDALPLPDAQGVDVWWQAQRGSYVASQRYILGEVATASTLRDALEHGPARWRHVRARELTVRSGRVFHVETRAFAQTQKRQLARAGTELTAISGWAAI
jgi:uncharacterized protein (TIGR02270 family)